MDTSFRPFRTFEPAENYQVRSHVRAQGVGSLLSGPRSRFQPLRRQHPRRSGQLAAEDLQQRRRSDVRLSEFAIV